MRIKDRSTVYAYSISVCMGSFVFGYELSSFGNVLELMATQNDYIDASDRAMKELLVTSILALSAIFGT